MFRHAARICCYRPIHINSCCPLLDSAATAHESFAMCFRLQYDDAQHEILEHWYKHHHIPSPTSIDPQSRSNGHMVFVWDAASAPYHMLLHSKEPEFDMVEIGHLPAPG